MTFASPGTFGASSITSLTSRTADATYPLMAGNVNLTNLANPGSSDAQDRGSGEATSFQALSPSGPSLVVVPEPTSVFTGVASLGLATLLPRRRAT